MRTFTLLAMLLAPVAARAEALTLDTGFLEEAALLAAKGGSSGVLSGVGVGVQVGTPTALTFKFDAGPANDIVLGVGVGFDFVHQFAPGLSLHGDYLFTVARLLRNGAIDLDAYIGPGLWLTLFNGGYAYIGGPGLVYYNGPALIGIGGRLPLGVNCRFTGAPIEVYLELDPALFVFPGIGGFIGASLGFRWFF